MLSMKRQGQPGPPGRPRIQVGQLVSHLSGHPGCSMTRSALLIGQLDLTIVGYTEETINRMNACCLLSARYGRNAIW